MSGWRRTGTGPRALRRGIWRRFFPRMTACCRARLRGWRCSLTAKARRTWYSATRCTWWKEKTAAPAKRVADYAVAHGVTYVNHTFTSHLALCASLQPYAGLKDHVICEYPFAPKPVAWDMSETHLEPDANGEVRVPDAPGLGIAMSKSGIGKYLVDVEIRAKGMLLYRTPDPLA